MVGDGVFLFIGEDVYFVDVLKGELKNFVGVGDLMIVGFVGIFDKMRDFVKVFVVGVVIGGVIVFLIDLV